MYHLLFYEVVDDFVERRTPFREAHLKLAREAHERGDLLMAGSFGEPVDGAALLFSAADPATVERFVRADPYVNEGLVTDWRVRRWHEVLTEDASLT